MTVGSPLAPLAAPCVLIIGTGLTGAIAARRLLRSGVPHVELWEAAGAVGGRMRSEVQQRHSPCP